MNDPRVEAVARIIRENDVLPGNLRPPLDLYIGDAQQALINADAVDREEGIHRVRADDATVERVAEVIYRKKNPQGNWAGHTRIFKDVYRAEAMPLIEAMLGDES